MRISSHVMLNVVSHQDEGYEEGSYRSLLTDLLDSNAASSKPELARRMEELALPVVSKLAAAATKLIQ